MSSYPFGDYYEPPAPILPIWLHSPSGAGIGVPALVDTGADITVVAPGIIEQLGTPIIGTVQVCGFGGSPEPAPTYAALVQIEGLTLQLPVVAYGEETILGRDLLNKVVLRLDGPDRTLEVLFSRPET